jgi:hypothetical protein
MPAGRLRHDFRRRVAVITDSLARLMANLKPRTQENGSQRMCPFCGLITPRSKRACLECGKSFGAVQLERKQAKHG